MSGSTNFLQFDSTKTNMLTDILYAGSTAQLNGVSSGIALSQLHNKIFYQATTFVAAFSQVFANLGYTVSDSNIAALELVLANILTVQGGTLTAGNTFVLGRDPAAALEAATMQYVNNLVTGAIFYFPATTAPTGFVKANGALLSRTTYSNLWTYAQASSNLVSEATWTATQWGSFSVGDGSTTFRIPDLRGEFMRGFDDSRGVDPGRVLGTWQQATGIGYSTGNLNSPSRIANGFDHWDPQDAYSATTYDPITPVSSSFTDYWFRVRPRNLSLLACIKY